MSTHHAKLIRAIFDEPLRHNIQWRDVESLLRHVGAEIEPLSGARLRVSRQGVESILFRPHHHHNTLDKPGLERLRAFLARAGVTPSLYEAGDEPAH
jgi:hypothetical protein